MSTITDEISKLTLPDLTTGTLAGTGTFDGLMRSVKAHLMEEFSAGRITGGEYTKAYIALVQVAMANALQFLLSKDQTYWTAVTAQKNVETIQYNLDNILPVQLAMTQSQKTGQDKANEITDYNLASLLPAQLTLVKEQGEAQRAQTLDTRTDTAPVAGSVKSQKDLYAQQIISYQRSSEVNAAKIFTDAWVADSAIQDSPIVPTSFTSANISAVLDSIKSKNNL